MASVASKSSGPSKATGQQSVDEQQQHFENMLEKELDNQSHISNSSSSTQTTNVKQAKQVTKADHDEDMFSDDEMSDEEAAANLTVGARLKRRAEKQAKAFARNFVDYGPPYAEEPVEGTSLSNECSQLQVKIYAVHKLLNARMNPNEADPDDLYYTATHWCARNAHLLAMKMLRRGGANLDVSNELGQTPLILCVLMQHPPDKRLIQVKMAKYLVNSGVDVNVRDKGGFSPIDYCAMNQDGDLCEFFINHGAKVSRENKTLVAKRHHILKYVHDPACYKILRDRLQFEEGEQESYDKMRAEEAKVLAEELRRKKLHLALAKRRQNRIELSKQELLDKRVAELALDKQKRADVELAARDAKKAEAKHAKGHWLRSPEGAWDFQDRQFSNSKDPLYADCKDLMKSLRDSHKKERFNDRWQQLTEGRNLEIEWKKSEPFEMEGLDSPDKGAGITAAGEGLGDSPEELTYRDENDEELDGEDLDDMMTALTSVSPCR